MKITIALVCLALVGCAGMDRVTAVKVAVPIKCQTATPQRPVMPTEDLDVKAKPFEILRAALAEISFREGYEGELVAALKSCQ